MQLGRRCTSFRTINHKRCDRLGDIQREFYAPFISLLFLLAGISYAHPADRNGRVVSVADGDTVTLLDAQKVQHRIRLSGIDAPERGQRSGVGRARIYHV